MQCLEEVAYSYIRFAWQIISFAQMRSQMKSIAQNEIYIPKLMHLFELFMY